MSDFRQIASWLSGFYKPLKKRLILIAMQSVAVAFISASIPYVYIGIFDGIQEQLSAKYLTQSICLLLGLGVLNFFFSVTNATRRAKTNLELEWQFRQRTFATMIRMDQSFFDQFRVGDLVTRLTDDVGRKLSWFACSGIFRAFESILRISFSITAMTLINPKLTLIALIPFPFQIIIYLKTIHILDSRFKTLQKWISQVNETIETCFSGIKIIQAYCAENEQAIKFQNAAEDRAQSEIAAEKAHIFIHQLYGYFWQLAQIIVLIAGGWMVISGNLTIGQYVAFDYYILFLVWPMYDIGGVLVGYRRASVSIKRVMELDKMVPSIQNPAVPVTPSRNDNKFIFENVSLVRGNQTVLTDISFDSADHRLIAVTGEIGSGKTSLLSLLCRFYDPTTGQVLLDNVPLNHQKLSTLRNQISYISQEPLLFTDSVRNNIRFGRNTISDPELISAADVAQLTSEIQHFYAGFDTPIGLRGMTVSGGQKQRISIARALAGNPNILVMDDATAHLDAETENTLWNSLLQTLPDMRIFVSSHRTSTLERAGLILVLKNGKLVERGQHQELLNLQGEYFRIYSRQKLQESNLNAHIIS